MRPARFDISTILKITFLFFLSLLAMFIYLPGIGSGFLLDDFYNLQNLDQVGEYGYGTAIFSSGIAGPSGRPLALLTFALQYASWPNNPAAFKLFNICLHLVNGALIYILSSILAGLATRDNNRRFLLAVIVTFLWLLHPIQVSTTLYVVQRMTQLSTLFTLLGIIGYLHIRLQYAPDYAWHSLLMMGLIVFICTILAVLSKENGILLPLYLLIVEGTLLTKSAYAKHLAVWKLFFLVAPLLILVCYLSLGFREAYRSYHMQDYNMPQKVLTEGVVLTEYIWNIFIPRPSVFGLYHDDFPISENLFTPPVTFISLVIVSGSLWFALAKRKTLPVFGFSVLWFLGGHALESTYLNLELYFEHRNYLPSFGLYFFLAWLVIRAADILSGKYLVYAAAGTYSLLVITITILEIDVWSKPGVQAVEWARRHPHSERALQDLLQFYLINEDYNNVERTISKLINLAPNHIYPYLDRVYIEACRKQIPVADAEWMEYMEYSGRAKADKLRTVVVLDQIVLNVLKGLCESLDTKRLTALIKRLIDNPEFSGDSAYLYEYLSALALFSEDYKSGLIYIRQSLQKEFTIPRKLNELKLLSRMGETSLAQAGKQELLEYIRKDYRLQWGYSRMIEAVQFK